MTDKERAVIEAARRYVWHWAGFHQPENWGAERNNRAFALAQALAALDAPEAVNAELVEDAGYRYVSSLANPYPDPSIPNTPEPVQQACRECNGAGGFGRRSKAMETKEQRRERLKSAIWSKMDWICTEPCWTDKNPSMAGCVCIADAADAIIASDEAAGLVVVPVEPTDLMIRACADIDTTFPPGAGDAKKYYRAMIAAAKE